MRTADGGALGIEAVLRHAAEEPNVRPVRFHKDLFETLDDPIALLEKLHIY